MFAKKNNDFTNRPPVVDHTPNMSVRAAVTAVEERKQEPSPVSPTTSDRAVSASGDTAGAKLTDASNKLNRKPSSSDKSGPGPSNKVQSNKKPLSSQIAGAYSNVASTSYPNGPFDENSNIAVQNIDKTSTGQGTSQLSSTCRGTDKPPVCYTSAKDNNNARPSCPGDEADSESISNLHAVTTLLSKGSSSSSFPGERERCDGDDGTTGICTGYTEHQRSTGMLDDKVVLQALERDNDAPHNNSITIETGHLDDDASASVLSSHITPMVVERRTSNSPDDASGVLTKEHASIADEKVKHELMFNEKELHARLERLEQEPESTNTRRREDDSEEDNEVDKDVKRMRKEVCAQFYPVSPPVEGVSGVQEQRKNDGVETGVEGVSGDNKHSVVFEKTVSHSSMSDRCTTIQIEEKQMKWDPAVDTSGKDATRKKMTASSFGVLARAVSRFHMKRGTQGSAKPGKKDEDVSKRAVSNSIVLQTTNPGKEGADIGKTSDAACKDASIDRCDIPIIVDSANVFTTNATTSISVSTSTTSPSIGEDDQTQITATATGNDFESLLPRSSQMKAEICKVDNDYGKRATWPHPVGKDLDGRTDSDDSSLFGSTTTKCQVTFTWAHTRAKRVCISGSFNDWATDQAMDAVDDVFEIDLSLAQGKHLYKFIVDGQWFYDITKESEYDEDRNVNNVLYL